MKGVPNVQQSRPRNEQGYGAGASWGALLRPLGPGTLQRRVCLFQLAGTVPVFMVRGRLQQDGFYLVGLATIGIVVGVWLNWRNDRVGFWMNAVAVSLGDIPFIFFVLLPGYMPFWPGVLGAGPLGRRSELHSVGTGAWPRSRS